MSVGQEHHILFPRALWRSQCVTKDLRNERMLRPPLDSISHDVLHRKIGIIAVPSFIMAQRIGALFEPVEGDFLRSLDNLRFAVEEANIGMPKVEQLIGEAMLAGLDEQVPIIRFGLVD